MGTVWTSGDASTALERVRDIVRPFPEAELQETSEYGHTGFAVRGSRFAWLTVDHHDDGRLALWIKSTLDEQAALVADDRRFFVPPYSGPQGWVGALLDPASGPDWDQVAELLEAAWRSKAPKRTQAAYDAAVSGR
jgi:hypothetical protein